jgi:serralysin
MKGLGGNDTYYVDNALDKVVEGIGGGTADWVATSVSYTLATGVQVEKLGTTSSGATTAINLTGNEFAQSITGNAGANRLNGAGAADTMSGLGGNDTYYVDNAGDRIVEGAGQGAADWVATSVSYTLAAGVQVEKLGTTSSGATSALSLAGNEFAQTIIGNAGANTISGKLGSDTLTGGAGADIFAFDTALNALTNVDTITDFSAGIDRIRLENSVFLGLATGVLDDEAFYTGTSATEPDDRIVYDAATGRLFYDPDGSDAGGAMQFATLTASLPLTYADFFVV